MKCYIVRLNALNLLGATLEQFTHKFEDNDTYGMGKGSLAVSLTVVKNVVLTGTRIDDIR